jgi:hypothetical protein
LILNGEVRESDPAFPRFSKPPPSATRPRLRTGSICPRLAAQASGCTQVCAESGDVPLPKMVPSPLSPYSANGATSDPATMMRRTTTGRRRELAQILQRLPADDRLRRPHPVPRATQPSLEVRELLASVSPTLFVVDPRRRLGDRMTILRFAKLHPASPGGREVFDKLGAHSSEARLLLLLGGDLALCGCLLLRRGFRLRCFLHHTALLVRA